MGGVAFEFQIQHTNKHLCKAMSNTEDPVSEDGLKRLAGEFDLETIMVLDLSDKGLTSYGCLPQCTQLRVLNLSLNQLSSLFPLSGLTSLQNLDLSANQITTLDGVDKLESLRELNLAGNNIIELDSLLPLFSLPHLSHLTLSLPGSSPHLTNPVCSNSSYPSVVKDSLVPWLVWLDGEKVGGEGAEFFTKCRQVEEKHSCTSNNTHEDSKLTNTSQESLPDPLSNFSLTEDSSEDVISKLLSECTETSGRIQRHIQSLQTLVTSHEKK